MSFLLPCSTILLYFLTSMLLVVHIVRGTFVWRVSSLAVGIFTVFLHALLLHQWIDVQSGQNLTSFNLLSMSLWLVSILVLVLLLFESVDVLALIIFPLTLISIILKLIFPASVLFDLSRAPQSLFHILLSMLTCSVLLLAGLQAIIIIVQDRLLRFASTGAFVRKLPSLVSMESLLFHLITGSFVTLSVLLFSSIYTFHADLLQHQLLFSKSLIVITAWFILVGLLLGRLFGGLRGRVATYCTLAGVVLLVLVFFGSRVLLEGIQ